MKIRLIAAVAALAMLAAPAAVAEDLPSAGDVFEKFVEATGGKDAIGKLKSRQIEGVFILPAMNMEANYSLIVEPPNSRNVIVLDAFGEVIRGVTDDTAFVVSPMEGAQILKGQQRAQLLRQSSFDEFLNWEDRFESAKVIEQADLDGSACYVVEVQPKGDVPSKQYFDAESGLLKQVVVEDGAATVTTTLGDYKKVDDFTLPHKIESSGGQLEFELTYETIKHNEPVADGTFDLPPEIEALMKSE